MWTRHEGSSNAKASAEMGSNVQELAGKEADVHLRNSDNSNKEFGTIGRWQYSNIDH